MKNFIILNVSKKITQYFFSNDIAHAKAKVHVLHWLESETVVCSLIDGWYEPTLAVNEPRLKCFEAYAHLNSYLSKYLLALSCLPGNFPISIKFRKAL